MIILILSFRFGLSKNENIDIRVKTLVLLYQHKFHMKLTNLRFTKVLLDLQLWLEGSYELGCVHPSIFLSFYRLSFCPSVILSESFLRIGSLVFSETQHVVRGACGVVHGRAGFFLKIFFTPKMGKMGKKWTKYRVFWIYWKICNYCFFKVYIIYCTLVQIPFLG